MKFTNGYWLVRDQYTPIYAVEYFDSEIHGDELVVYASTVPVQQRGMTLNSALITVRLSSPMENVIKVSIAHFLGVPDKQPSFEKKKKEGNFVTISEDKEKIVFSSGRTNAVISKAKPYGWSLTFEEDGRLITGSAFRNMSCMVDKAAGKSYMLEQLLLDIGENVYGLGERYTPFVKNGQEVSIWNEDGGTASEQTYKNIPFYISSKGYGVFVDNPGDVQFELGSEKVERVSFSVEGQKLEYYLINGSTPKHTIELYTDLTGKPALPPAWSFGLWLTTSFTTSYDEETVTSFIQGMEDRNIPLHTFHFDCFWMKAYEWCSFEWDSETFPDPVGMLQRYKDRGLHICVWINSYIGQKSKLFKEGMEKGYFVKRTDGSVWQTDLWQAGMALVDFTNPAAVDWYTSKLEVLLDMGVDCFKTDFGERIPVTGVQYYDGSDPVRMHNYYTFLYNQAVFRLLERKRGLGEATLFARSATAGGQQFPVHWGGDCSASYLSMAETLRGGLSLSLCGFGFWSHDIGGFESTASADVYKRWCAFGLLSSHSRLHGSQTYRVPWLFDEEACDVLRFFVNLKCRLMPYLYAKAMEAHEKGIPMLRAMFLEFPDDPNCLPLDRQYMLGDSLLVAPVFRSNGEVSYYLPAGRWTHLISGEEHEGGRWYNETYDYFSLPLFVREGSIIAFGDNDQTPDYDYENEVTYRVFPKTDGQAAKEAQTMSATIIRADQTIGQTIALSMQDGKLSWRMTQASVKPFHIEIGGRTFDCADVQGETEYK